MKAAALCAVLSVSAPPAAPVSLKPVLYGFGVVNLPHPVLVPGLPEHPLKTGLALAAPAELFLPRAVVPAPGQGGAEPMKPLARAAELVSAIQETFQAVGEEGRGGERVRPARLASAFDGAGSAGKTGGAVDPGEPKGKPESGSEDAAEDGVEKLPLFPTIEPCGRPCTLPEWDLERELGLRR